MSPKKTIPKQRAVPAARGENYTVDTDGFYRHKPAWNFHTCIPTVERWRFDQDHVGTLLWSEIIPFFVSLETKTWQEILITNKKQNHSISVSDLHNEAAKCLEALQIDTEQIISLRLNGTHRIYGYIEGHTFCLLWFDLDHGDNDTCVCRSYLKHT